MFRSGPFLFLLSLCSGVRGGRLAVAVLILLARPAWARRVAIDRPGLIARGFYLEFVLARQRIDVRRLNVLRRLQGFGFALDAQAHQRLRDAGA